MAGEVNSLGGLGIARQLKAAGVLGPDHPRREV